MNPQDLPNHDAIQYCREILTRLKQIVGSTPLYELWPGQIPYRNRIFAKAESENPTGSHYDRVYVSLFESKLHQLVQRQYSTLAETSSGNAAASFAWLCAELDLPCTVFLPADLPPSFVDHIRHWNARATVITCTDGQSYLKGVQHDLKRQMVRARQADQNRPMWCLDHSRAPETLKATATIGTEAAAQLRADFGVTRLDYYIAACGNGSTIVGPGVVLRREFPDLRVLGFEPQEAPCVHSYLSGTEPTAVCGQRHQLYGTGAWGIKFPFLHDQQYNLKTLLTQQDIVLVDRKRFARISTHRRRTAGRFGFTSMVGLDIALEMAETCREKTFLLLFYDRGHKYDALDI
jgi:cysteine synthase A